ncbi:MAG: murein L,D-transpeptidase catalytic domain family protein, partial [Deltaproteobacteria bacterium]
MKLIFTLLSILTVNAVLIGPSFANTDADPQELEQKISTLYSSINPEGLSQDVFRIAYLKYIKFSSEGKLGNKSLITVVDFNKPSNQDRLWIMDVNEGAPKLIKKSLVTHGEKSGYLMAENFSNQDGTHMSSLKFYITGEPYQSTKVGYALKLHGQDPGINSNIFPRGIVMHRAVYATYERAARGAIGRSWGCLGVPTEYNRMFVDLLRGKTLIYVHSDKNPGSSPTITSDMVTAARNVSSSNQSPDVPASTDPPMTYANNPAFDGVRGQQTLGAQNGTNSVPLLGNDGDPAALAIADDQREVAPASENDAPEKVGMAELHGTAGFEACQNLATEPWCSIVTKVKAGADPHQFFEASWNDVQSKMENSDNVEDSQAEAMAKNNLGMIRECAALVHLTDKTDCEKDKKNEDDEKESAD